MLVGENISLFAPFRNVSWPIARLCFVVEDLAELASVSAGNVAVDTDVEVLTVIGIRISRVRNSD